MRERQAVLASESRKDQEREFHNLREQTRLRDVEAHDSIYTNRQFYRITDTSKQYLHGLLERYCASAEVLDYCCGTGQVSRTIAGLGGNVTGIDISDVSIETAQRLAEEAGLSARTRFVAGDAENTNFPDASFDVVVASGVLHHVDLDAAYAEIARVLRPGGVVICIEALAHNPLIMAYRRRTPHLRTPFEIDHILRVQDIQKARKYFDSVEISYWHLAAIGAIPFRNTIMFRPLLKVLDRIDRVLVRLPGVQKYAWQSIFILSEPRAR